MNDFFSSKKVKMTLLTMASSAIATIVGIWLGLDSTQINTLLISIGLPGATYIGAQGYVDAKKQ